MLSHGEFEVSSVWLSSLHFDTFWLSNWMLLLMLFLFDCRCCCQYLFLSLVAVVVAEYCWCLLLDVMGVVMSVTCVVVVSSSCW